MCMLSFIDPSISVYNIDMDTEIEGSMNDNIHMNTEI